MAICEPLVPNSKIFISKNKYGLVFLNIYARLKNGYF